MSNKIIWLTGQSGAGKTTLAKALQKEYPCIVLDGDDMRKSISLGAGFSLADRNQHNCKVARLANELSKQTNVIIAVIAPVSATRIWIDTNYPSITFVYVKRTLPAREGHFYEEPVDYPTVDHDRLDIESSLNVLKQIMGISEHPEPVDDYKI